MKQMLKVLCITALLVSTVAAAKVVPFILPRSQSENAARELVLWQTEINQYGKECNYNSLSLAAEYEKTFRDDRIASYLFADALTTYNETTCGDNKDCNKADHGACPSFKVQGSLVDGRASNALLADYFGLPMDYSSVVTIKPEIENFMLDFNWYWGMDKWVEGMYFRIHAPLTHSRWNLHFEEHDIKAGELAYPGGYFNGQITNALPATVARENLVSTFGSFVGQEAAPAIPGVSFQPLTKAKMFGCDKNKTKLSDLQMALGWNFVSCEDYHFGLNIRGAAPTGNRPEGTWLFEPIVGNGKHWELGAGLTSRWTAWRSDDEIKDFTIYLDANLTHLFKSHQCRTFDLCGKPLSRYMLAEQMTSNVQNLFDAVGGDMPAYQFANVFAPVANLSTIEVDSSMAVQGEIALKFAFTCKNWQLDLGYDFWGRSCEKITPRCDCQKTEPTTWALKGDAMVYGFAYNDDTEEFSSPTPLSATDTDATIFCGNNNPQRAVPSGTVPPTYLSWKQNPGVDNADIAYTTDSLGNLLYSYVPEITGGERRGVLSSFPPVVFSTDKTDHLDIQAARTKSLTNKLFGNLGYVWKERCDTTPYLGLGFEVEFGQKNDENCCTAVTTCATKNPGDAVLSSLSCGNNCCTTSNTNNNCCKDNCDDNRNDNNCCSKMSLSQWGVWVKGGVTFN